jgi:hypothetical protein
VEEKREEGGREGKVKGRVGGLRMRKGRRREVRVRGGRGDGEMRV